MCQSCRDPRFLGHGQVSFESIAICYKYAYKTENKLVSSIFETYGNEADDRGTDERGEEASDMPETNSQYFLKYHLNRKQVSSGF